MANQAQKTSKLKSKWEVAKVDKTRQLSIEQQNAIDLLVQGKSDRETAEAIGVSRQTVNNWRNNDPVIRDMEAFRSEKMRF